MDRLVIIAGMLIVLFSSTTVFASEPGGVSLIIFFAGLIFAPLLQLILYPILIFADKAKPWTIIALGVISLAWSAYVSYSLADPYASIYFAFAIIIFAIAYFTKISKIKNTQ